MSIPDAGALASRWRRLLAIDLGLFNVALFLFAMLPPENIVPVEWSVMILASLCAVGVVSHALASIRIPGEQWSYLMTGAGGLYVFGVYSQVESVPLSVKIPYLAFLLSGSASGYAAHVIDGGRGHE